MRHSGGGPYAPQGPAETGLEQQHLKCTCFVSKHAHKFTSVFYVFLEKQTNKQTNPNPKQNKKSEENE